MIEKSAQHPCFYRLIDASDDGRETFESLPATAGPWTPEAQHGGPPAALLARAVERLSERRAIGRFTMELHGPVPVGAARDRRHRAAARAVGAAGRRRAVRRGARPGRRLGPRVAVPGLRGGPRPAEAAGARARPTARATSARPPGTAATSTPWSGGGSPGSVDDARARAWSGCGRRPSSRASRSPRCSGCSPAPTRRPASAPPSTCGRWAFLNTELTVHVLRPPVGEWVCLDAETTLSSGSVGVAAAEVSDEPGWSPAPPRRCWSRRAEWPAAVRELPARRPDVVRVVARADPYDVRPAQSWIRAQGRASSSS